MSKKILVIDDDRYILDLLDNIFSDLGYTVLLKNKKFEILDVLEEYQPDLLLIDINMPEISGIELCKQIREHKNFNDIPIILMTGLKDTNLKLEALKSGADEFLNKPLDLAELMIRVENQIKLKKEREKSKLALKDLEVINQFSEDVLSRLSFDMYGFSYTLDNFIIDLISDEYKNKNSIPEYIFVFYRKNHGKNVLYYRFDPISKSCIEKKEIKNIDYLIEYDIKKLLVVKDKQDFDRMNINPAIKEFLYERVDNFLYYSITNFSILASNLEFHNIEIDAHIFKSFAIHLEYYFSVLQSLEKINEMFRYSIYSLSRAAEVWDDDTGEHILRVNEYSYELAKGLGMSESFSQRIKVLAQLHDVGKLHVHPDILRKPGRLTKEEWEEMKMHTIYGAKILGDNEEFKIAKIIALQHHESWDGIGYPNGLKGNKIHIAARIVKLADVYDALRSSRAYKPAFSHERTCEIILKGDDRLNPASFDPDILNYFRMHNKRFEEIYEEIK